MGACVDADEDEAMARTAYSTGILREAFVTPSREFRSCSGKELRAPFQGPLRRASVCPGQELSFLLRDCDTRGVRLLAASEE